MRKVANIVASSMTNAAMEPAGWREGHDTFSLTLLSWTVAVRRGSGC